MKRILITCALLLIAIGRGFSQPVTINTLAGYAGRSGGDGLGSNARFNHPHGLAIDGATNIYVADTDNHTIRRITPAGVVSTVAGLAGVSGAIDDSAGNARFLRPQGVAVDGTGIIYVADTGNHTIRRISPTGVSTIAGVAGVSGSNNGNGAHFNQPTGVAVDGSGTIYVADFGNGAVRKIALDLTVSTIATLSGPQTIAADSGGNLWVADFSGSAIWKISSGGMVTILAGSTNVYGAIDGNGTNAHFYYPAAVALDTSANAYVADSFNHIIRKITAGGSVTTASGLVNNPGSNDGTLATARFHGPQGIAVDKSFNVYVADTENSLIRKIASGGTVSTLAGSPSAAAADALMGSARFNWPAAVALDSSGTIYLADAQNHTIRKILSNGSAATLAGLPGNPGSADGSGNNARFSSPEGIAIDASENLYVADTANHTIRKISSVGVVSTLAGASGYHGSVDDVGTNANFYAPQGVAVDGAGNVFVADTLNHTIRQISSGGVVTTIAGLPENPGGADGTNSTARFNWPIGLTIDSSGALFVADYFNNGIRKVVADGANWIISTVAGLPGLIGNVDGTNSNARFCHPRGIVADASGTLFVTDSGNNAIRRVVPSGTNWIVSTIAGSIRGSVDGTGGVARFNVPAGIAADSSGFLYIADAANNTIRVNRIVPPQLQIVFAGNRAILSWSALAAGFVLESTSAFSPTATWTPVNGWSVSGDNVILNADVSAAAAIYRLRKP